MAISLSPRSIGPRVFFAALLPWLFMAQLLVTASLQPARAAAGAGASSVLCQIPADPADGAPVRHEPHDCALCAFEPILTVGRDAPPLVLPAPSWPDAGARPPEKGGDGHRLLRLGWASSWSSQAPPAKG